MSVFVITLLVASAIVHAGWNAIVKNSDDRLWSIAVITLVGAVAALPFAILLPQPNLMSLPFLALSSLLQIGYCLFLIRAYQDADLASVYPIARGSAPLLVTFGAAVFAREIPNAYGLAGIAFVSLGLMALVIGASRPDLKSTLAALISGVFIASYMVVDGLGVRVSERAISYAAWQAVTAGCLIPLSFVIIRRRAPALPQGKDGFMVVVAGILSTLGYCIAVWAMSLTSMGGVSAIRETSILFAALIGILVLHERMTASKVIGAIAVTFGVICLSIS